MSTRVPAPPSAGEVPKGRSMSAHLQGRPDFIHTCGIKGDQRAKRGLIFRRGFVGIKGANVKLFLPANRW